MKFAALILFTIVLVGGWNWFAFQSLQSPAAAAIDQAARAHAERTPNATGSSTDSALELPWPLLEKIILQNAPVGRAQFPPELVALNGKFVHISGVFSPLQQLASGSAYLGGVLQPPSKLACCGITCDPRTQLLVFVDCSDVPWTAGKDRKLVSVIGKLELTADNSGWGNTTLSDTRVVPLK